MKFSVLMHKRCKHIF